MWLLHHSDLQWEWNSGHVAFACVAGFEERYADERRKLAVSGERVATDMLAAESVKLRGIMTGPGASVEAVESELRRWVACWYHQP